MRRDRRLWLYFHLMAKVAYFDTKAKEWNLVLFDCQLHSGSFWFSVSLLLVSFALLHQLLLLLPSVRDSSKRASGIDSSASIITLVR